MKHLLLTGIVVAGVITAGTSFAQKRPYNLLMQDVQATFASLRKNLDAKAGATAAEDAAKLVGLFKETEAFWAPFKTKDALDAAKGAQQAAAAIGCSQRQRYSKGAVRVCRRRKILCRLPQFTSRTDAGQDLPYQAIEKSRE